MISSRIEVYVTKINSFFKLFFERFVDSNINNAAIVIAYNALLAIFPTVILVGNLLPLLNLKADTIMSYLQTAMPPTIYKTLNPLVRTFLTSGSGGIASVSALVAIWAASRGINALKRAINDAYGVDSQSAFMTRIVSIAIIFVFAIFLVALFIFFSFGQLALEKLSPILNLPLSWLDTFRSVKWPTAILLYFSRGGARDCGLAVNHPRFFDLRLLLCPKGLILWGFRNLYRLIVLAQLFGLDNPIRGSC